MLLHMKFRPPPRLFLAPLGTRTYTHPAQRGAPFLSGRWACSHTPLPFECQCHMPTPCTSAQTTLLPNACPLGAIEAGEAENIFAEEGEAKAAAHSPYESLKQGTQQQQPKIAAASAYERRRNPFRSFAAMFL